MNQDQQNALAEHKAKIDAKYARLAAIPTPPSPFPSWLLIGPDGVVDAVLANYCATSETEAFEYLYPRKRARMKAAAEGWRCELDDDERTGFNRLAQLVNRDAGMQG